MTITNKIKGISKKGDNKTKNVKKRDERKYKKGKDSDSEGDNIYNSSGSETEMEGGSGGSAAGGVASAEQKFDMGDYRKMLAEMFPSKYMDKKVKMGEKIKKLLKNIPNIIYF